MNNTELFLFESAFARDTYQRTIGITGRAGALRLQWRDPPTSSTRSRRPPTPPDSRRRRRVQALKGADLLIDAVARLAPTAKR